MSERITATVLKRGNLSPAEAKVLRFLCEGYHRKEIALKLFRATSTVNRHIESISKKLDAHCQTEIVVLAVASGMVSVNTSDSYKQHVLVLIALVIFMQIFIESPKRRPPRSPRLQFSSYRIRHEATC